MHHALHCTRHHIGHYHTGSTDGLAKPRRHRRRQGGLTLIELIVAIAVLAIMATVAVPSFQQFTARNEVAAEVMRIKTALALARNTAVKRRKTISVCASPGPAYDTCTFDNWNHDWVIVEGDATGSSLAENTVLRVLTPGGGGTTVTFNRDYPIRYQATGWSRGHNGTFTICGRHGQIEKIIVSNMGRARVEDGQAAC